MSILQTPQRWSWLCGISLHVVIQDVTTIPLWLSRTSVHLAQDGPRTVSVTHNLRNPFRRPTRRTWRGGWGCWTGRGSCSAPSSWAACRWCWRGGQSRACKWVLTMREAKKLRKLPFILIIMIFKGHRVKTKQASR